MLLNIAVRSKAVSRVRLEIQRANKFKHFNEIDIVLYFLCSRVTKNPNLKTQKLYIEAREFFYLFVTFILFCHIYIIFICMYIY